MPYVMSNDFSFFLADALVGVRYTSHLSNMMMDGFDDGILTNIITSDSPVPNYLFLTR